MEERLQNPFYAPKEKYTDSFIGGYGQALYHMRHKISDMDRQGDNKEMNELFKYSEFLMQKMMEHFSEEGLES